MRIPFVAMALAGMLLAGCTAPGSSASTPPAGPTTPAVSTSPTPAPVVCVEPRVELTPEGPAGHVFTAGLKRVTTEGSVTVTSLLDKPVALGVTWESAEPWLQGSDVIAAVDAVAPTVTVNGMDRVRAHLDDNPTIPNVVVYDSPEVQRSTITVTCAGGPTARGTALTSSINEIGILTCGDSQHIQPGSVAERAMVEFC